MKVRQFSSNAEGKREIVRLDVGTNEDGAFWLSFLRSLAAGLHPAQLSSCRAIGASP